MYVVFNRRPVQLYIHRFLLQFQVVIVGNLLIHVCTSITLWLYDQYLREQIYYMKSSSSSLHASICVLPSMASFSSASTFEDILSSSKTPWYCLSALGAS